jgi:hypothetical protein
MMNGMNLTAVGVPVVTGPAEGWNFWPLIGIPLALFLAFRWLKLRRTTWIAIAAILVGLLTADMIRTWGVLPVGAMGVGLAAGWSIAIGRSRRGRPPTV